jgi:hypothetical protein
MPLIPIAAFSKPEDAHLLRLRLEAGGVPAHVQDENTATVNWMLSDAIGGVKVLIEEEDAERAREILADEPGEVADPSRPVCPRCQSPDTSPADGPRRRSFLSMLLLGFPLPVNRHRWHCTQCQTTWDERTGRLT